MSNRIEKLKWVLLLQHRHHVELSHRVKAQNLRKLLEAGSLLSTNLFAALGTRVHVVPLQRILDRNLVQRFVQIAHIRHLTPNRVELLQRSTHVATVL